MEEIEDFKYEFDFRIGHCHYSETKAPLMLYLGYLYLHQFSKQNLIQQADKYNIIRIIESLLEDGEKLIEYNGVFELYINNIDDETMEYLDFLLTNSLVKTKNLRCENNVIKWEIDDKD